MTSTILIVEDMEANRLVLQSTLEEDGYHIECAVDGLDALEKIPALLPDLILLDIMMPRMDGYEVCRWVRRNPALMEIPVVMLTALDDRESMLRGLEAGADDFLHKPYDRYELRARVHSITRLNRYRSLVTERARLSEALKGLEAAYDATLRGWTLALDLRDNETEGHSERVAELTVELARVYRVNENALEHVRRGALLHDIGKIGVPDSILWKPGPLDDHEWVIMRKHPTSALNMLERIDYLRPSLDIPYCHHEKWDGTGYPRGLRGDQIPLSARIFAMVDVWDALTSDRPYRRAWTHEAALDYIKEQSGKHFDPQLVPAFEDFMVNRVKVPHV